jgi:hypothetical protein
MPPPLASLTSRKFRAFSRSPLETLSQCVAVLPIPRYGAAGPLSEPKTSRPQPQRAANRFLSAWLPVRCAEILVMVLPDDSRQGTRDALAQPSPTASEPPRSLTVVALIRNKRYYGETMATLRWDCGGNDADAGLGQEGGGGAEATGWRLWKANLGRLPGHWRQALTRNLICAGRGNAVALEAMIGYC